MALSGRRIPTLGSKVADHRLDRRPVPLPAERVLRQGHIAVCPTYTAATKNAFEDFRKLYRGHGPEGIPLSADKPGDGP